MTTTTPTQSVFLLGSFSTIVRAMELAAVAHRHQTRKGTEIPYIVHPFSVAVLLLNAGCSHEIIAAGILHDVLEDTTVSYETLRQEMGREIAEIVRQCSEPDKSQPWETRKREKIEYLREAPLAVKLVTAADKIDNLRSIATDRQKVGESVWDRFRRGREQQEWYYREATTSLMHGLPQEADRAMFVELQRQVEMVFGEA